MPVKYGFPGKLLFYDDSQFSLVDGLPCTANLGSYLPIESESLLLFFFKSYLIVMTPSVSPIRSLITNSTCIESAIETTVLLDSVSLCGAWLKILFWYKIDQLISEHPGTSEI